MATSLKSLVGTKSQDIFPEEINLEKGYVYTFCSTDDFHSYSTCWIAPATGIAQIELWGAGGSGARMCCCGGGLPGNAGGYSRKTIAVNAGDYVCGCTGMSCGNADALCWRGCGVATCVYWYGQDSCGNTEGCMCAQGGTGGYAYCSTGTSLWCCFVAGGFCYTGPCNSGCGLICNRTSGIRIACGYGGDINRCGGVSCVYFHGCLPLCPCATTYYVPVPPGLFAECGGVAVSGSEDGNDFSNWSGNGAHQSQHTINGLSRAPAAGIPWSYGWGFGGGCGCYENEGCSNNVGPGIGGMAPHPCPGVRDHGRRGGNGMIRIKFIQAS